jgi:DNA transformation protein and related proteins
MALDSFTIDIVQRLQLLGQVTARSMFGGAGLYCQGVFFGLTANEQLYLRVDDQTRPDYEAHGMCFFQPWPDKPTHGLRNYFEVPANIQRQREELCAWAAASLAIAQRAKPKSRTKSKPRTTKKSTTRSKKIPKKRTR